MACLAAAEPRPSDHSIQSANEMHSVYVRRGGIVLKSELSLAQKQRLLLSQQQWVRGGLGREAFPAGALVCCIFPLVAWHVYKPRGVWMLAVAVALAIFPKDADATRRYSKRSATQQ